MTYCLIYILIYKNSLEKPNNINYLHFQNKDNFSVGQKQHSNGFDNTTGEYQRMNGYNDRSNLNPPKVRNEEEERKKERLLQRRRIVQNQVSDDEIEHNKRMSDDEYFQTYTNLLGSF